jgi:LuxR family maltose regulon positive regulatory protein
LIIWKPPAGYFVCYRWFAGDASYKHHAARPDTLAAVENWCNRFTSFDLQRSPPGIGPFGAAEAYYLAGLTWMQIQIATGKADSMRAYLAQQLERASTHGLMHRVIELSLLDATLSHDEGDHNRAHASLERALGLAKPEGYICVFNQNPILITLLKQTTRQGLYKDYIEQILTSMDVMDSQYPGGETPTLFGESLSPRELDVLQLIAQGATNQEIADRFVISVGTVKSHINHILRKLDSHNRTEAVARARRLGLLHI